jgi:hypothetical protein
MPLPIPRSIAQKLRNQSLDSRASLPKKRRVVVDPTHLANLPSTGGDALKSTEPSDAAPSSDADDPEPVEYRRYLAPPPKRGRKWKGSSYKGIARTVAVYPGGEIKDIQPAPPPSSPSKSGFVLPVNAPPEYRRLAFSPLPETSSNTNSLSAPNSVTPSSGGHVRPVMVPPELRPSFQFSASMQRKEYEETTAARWASLLPQLVYPYLQWAMSTRNGVVAPDPSNNDGACACGGPSRLVRVSAVYLDRGWLIFPSAPYLI